MKNENVVNKNKCFPGKFLSGVSRLYSRLVNKETSLFYQQRISGRSRIKCGITPVFNNSAFTLIELLVVVLIIGILAAVAVPQYQNAVGRTRFSNLKNYTRALETACQVYKLGNNTFPPTPNDLEITFPIASSIVEASKTAWHINLKGGEHCTVWILEEKISCQTKIFQKAIAHYRFNNSSQGCVAFSTDTTDLVNQICRTDTKKRGNCQSGYYCLYDY